MNDYVQRQELRNCLPGETTGDSNLKFSKKANLLKLYKITISAEERQLIHRMHLPHHTFWWLCNLSIFQAHLIQSILYVSAKWFLSKYISSSVNSYRSKFSMAPYWLENKLTLSFLVPNVSVICCQYGIYFLFLHWLFIWIAAHLQTIIVHFWKVLKPLFFAYIDASKLSYVECRG